ncbi:MAG: N-acetyltransferase family protein [Gammaproteobacteria bacterium]|nr:N-acetyltransferase family protein [Gammaproteobacteria bacterium]
MVRELQDSDLERITEIYNYYIRRTETSFEESEIDSIIMMDRVEKIRKSGLPWLVADISGHIVGYCYAAPWHGRAAYKNTVEVTAYLDHEELRQGTGSLLYQELLLRLKDNGIRTAIGVIALPNQGSVALHEKFGFEKVGHLHSIGRKNGKWLDVGYWQVVIPGV